MRHPEIGHSTATHSAIIAATLVALVLLAPIASAQLNEPLPTRWMAPPGVERLPHPVWKATGPLEVRELEPVHPQESGLGPESMRTPDSGNAPGREAAQAALQGGRIVIVVQSSLYPSISSSIATYQSDLSVQGYTSLVSLVSGGTAEDLRAYLIGLYGEPSGLVGAVFVGTLPYAVYELMQDWDGSGGDPPEYEDFPCDIFFMDMNGTWLDDGAGGTVTPANGKYDGWSDSQKEIEIWVGRLWVQSLSAMGDPAQLLNNYFNKNHQYRVGNLVPGFPDFGGLAYVDDDWGDMVPGSGGDSASIAKIYNDVTAVYDIGSSPGNNATATDYKTNHMTVDYQLVLLRSHGYPGGHGFYQNSRSNFSYVYNSDYMSIDPEGLFYSLFVCSGCDYTVQYLGGTIAFNQDYGLVAWGSTKTGGQWLDSNFYTMLGQSNHVGAAFVPWFNAAHDSYPSGAPRWWYGMVMIGDPALVPDLPGSTHRHTIAGRVIDDATSTGYAGAIVSCTGPVSVSDTTETGGYYYLTGLPVGTYSVVASIPEHWESDPKTIGVPPDTSNVDFRFRAPIVTVLAPNGGESYQVSSSVSIQWEAWDPDGIDMVMIRLSTDGGTTYPTIIDVVSDPPPYLWTAPSRPKSQCKIRVTAYDPSTFSGSDVSDQTFQIIDDVEPSVTVVSPNGAEWLEIDDEFEIEWVATDNGVVDSVNIYLSTDGGLTWPYTIATSEANDSSFTWDVLALPGTLNRIRVAAYDGGLNAGEDVSDSDFTIGESVPPVVTVVTPNGGERLYVGGEYEITWVATDNQFVDSIGIFYSTDGGATFPYAVAAEEENDSTYTWAVPNTPSHNCLVRIVAHDSSLNSSADTSDAVFSIQCIPGVVALWHLEEGSGSDAFDSSGYSNHGTLENGAEWTSEGRFGNAVVLDSGDERVLVAGSPSLDIADSLTLEAWIKPAADIEPGGAPGDWQGIVVKGSAYSLLIDHNDDGKLALKTEHSGPTERWLKSRRDYWQAGEWYHVAGTYDGQISRLFVDGVCDTSYDFGTEIPIAVNDYDLGLGNDPAAGNAFAGAIDELRISNMVFEDFPAALHPSVVVLRPNGGEVFYADHPDTVKWIATDNFGVDSVSIYYSIDGGATFPHVIVREWVGGSPFVWTVPDTRSDSCLVRIVAYDGDLNASADTSDAFFLIRGPMDVEPVPGVPGFALSQNYPNPFNPVTHVEFNLDQPADVSLRVYDLTGKTVRTLVARHLTPGRHVAVWEGQDESGKPAASGIYVYRLEAAGKVATRKMVLLR
ncbi:MAG: LamG-like jellyroll fold domain-containing protein [Candidatus Eisenbacteria bacterium]